jgi:hypothetical protein
LRWCRDADDGLVDAADEDEADRVADDERFGFCESLSGAGGGGGGI